jgi:hypothetical protein
MRAAAARRSGHNGALPAKDVKLLIEKQLAHGTKFKRFTITGQSSDGSSVQGYFTGEGPNPNGGDYRILQAFTTTTLGVGGGPLAGLDCLAAETTEGNMVILGSVFGQGSITGGTPVGFLLVTSNPAAGDIHGSFEGGLLLNYPLTNRVSVATAGTAIPLTAQSADNTAQLKLVPSGIVGAPASGAHGLGEFSIDSAGSFWQCIVPGTPGTWKQVGATYNDVVTAETSGALSTAITAAAGAQTTIVLDAAYTLSAGESALTVPANITLQFVGNGSIVLPVGYVLTINGPIDALSQAIFSGSGLVVIGGLVPQVLVSWWAA